MGTDTYVALDLEMTGLHPKQDRIIEIGAVLVEEGEIKDRFSTFINPRMALPGKVTEITGIREADLAGAPEMKEMLTPLSDFLGDHCLLGHSILFDYSFLKRAFVNEKYAFEKKGIDTLKLARKFLPDLPAKRLGDVCRHYRISEQAHRALGDAMAAHLIYQKMKAEFYNEDTAKDFCPRPLVYKIKKEAPAGKKQKERLFSLLEKHKLISETDIDSMTKNEVSRLTDQILAKYGR